MTHKILEAFLIDKETHDLLGVHGYCDGTATIIIDERDTDEAAAIHLDRAGVISLMGILEAFLDGYDPASN